MRSPKSSRHTHRCRSHRSIVLQTNRHSPSSSDQSSSSPHGLRRTSINEAAVQVRIANLHGALPIIFDSRISSIGMRRLWLSMRGIRKALTVLFFSLSPAGNSSLLFFSQSLLPCWTRLTAATKMPFPPGSQGLTLGEKEDAERKNVQSECAENVSPRVPTTSRTDPSALRLANSSLVSPRHSTQYMLNGRPLPSFNSELACSEPFRDGGLCFSRA
jgi:hypothetical protein